MGYHTSILFVRQRRVADLKDAMPDLYALGEDEVGFADASSPALEPDCAWGAIGDWLLFWNPTAQLTFGAPGAAFRAKLLAGATALAVRLESTTDTYEMRWQVEGALVREARGRDEQWVFGVIADLTGLAYDALEDAVYRRIPFEGEAAGRRAKAGYRTSVMLVKGRSIEWLLPFVQRDYELTPGVELLGADGQFPTREGPCDLGVADVQGWLVIWDPCDENVWDPCEVPLDGETAFAAFLHDSQDWYGLRWLVEGTLLRQLELLRGSERDDEGAPLPGERVPSRGKRGAAWVLGIAEETTGVAWRAVEAARYRRLVRR